MLHKNLKPFPQDFLWGASTSAYQVEGANQKERIKKALKYAYIYDVIAAIVVTVIILLV